MREWQVLVLISIVGFALGAWIGGPPEHLEVQQLPPVVEQAYVVRGWIGGILEGLTSPQ